MAQPRYRILERIDAGGMAEVFRGVASSIQGFDKTVAIKRILPSLTRKRRFVRMFLDEARVSLQLNHGNIVQVFDLGRVDDTYFIVMEHIEGTNLRVVLERALDDERPFELGVAIYIAVEVCKALAYAHAKCDAAGQHLAIVHRDVSPPNILLSNDGEVKLVDFGLAKARSQVEKTEPGLVKGKFGYLSPEAAYGDAIDARADLFALGIVLWEMLAARRLFYAEQEIKTLDLVRKALVPSLLPINPKVDEELDGLLRRALARDKSRRYADAAEMGEALQNWLFEKRIAVGQKDIAKLVKRSGATMNAELSHGPDDGFIEMMIQEEIERFISLEDSAERAARGQLEDPSTWFDAEDLDHLQAFDPQRLRAIGPNRPQSAPSFNALDQSPSISTLIPIDVVQDILREASEARHESASVAGASDAPAQRCEGLAKANECNQASEARHESASVAGASDAPAQRCEGLAKANECNQVARREQLGGAGQAPNRQELGGAGQAPNRQETQPFQHPAEAQDSNSAPTELSQSSQLPSHPASTPTEPNPTHTPNTISPRRKARRPQQSAGLGLPWLLTIVALFIALILLALFSM
ncbi:MAG: serine/threonine-protein kinase [Myxococcota bacterium]|jgi:serine/threonine-protein kinase|nr:serine/threonine-protein kinase [Myxococcota bacterium]